MKNLETLRTSELLKLTVQIKTELRNRHVLRSENSPTGDWAEYLFCEAFGWEQMPNSVKGYDATDSDGRRYQIKSRRLHRRNASRQLSALRNLQQKPFDILAGLLFNEDYSVFRAALIPYELIPARIRVSRHTNSALFKLHDAIWDLPDVMDVTVKMRQTALQL